MFDFVQRFHHFRLRVAYAQHLVKAALNRDENVFIYGGGQYTSPVFVKERGKVSAAAKETHPEGCLYDYHELSMRHAL